MLLLSKLQFSQWNFKFLRTELKGKKKKFLLFNEKPVFVICPQNLYRFLTERAQLNATSEMKRKGKKKCVIKFNVSKSAISISYFHFLNHVVAASHMRKKNTTRFIILTSLLRCTYRRKTDIINYIFHQVVKNIINLFLICRVCTFKIYIQNVLRKSPMRIISSFLVD